MSDIMYGDTCLGWPGARGPFQTPVTRQQCLSAAWRRTAGGSTLGWAEGKSHSSDLRGDECQVLGGVPSRRGGCCCFFFWEHCGSWLRPNGLNLVKDSLKDPAEGTFLLHLEWLQRSCSDACLCVTCGHVCLSAVFPSVHLSCTEQL